MSGADRYWLWLTLDILWCASVEIPVLYSSRIDGLLMPYDLGGGWL